MANEERDNPADLILLRLVSFCKEHRLEKLLSRIRRNRRDFIAKPPEERGMDLVLRIDPEEGVHRALSQCFLWMATPEGSRFWRALHDFLALVKHCNADSHSNGGRVWVRGFLDDYEHLQIVEEVHSASDMKKSTTSKPGRVIKLPK